MQLLHASRNRLYIHVQFLRQFLLLGAVVRDELVQRRINQPDSNGEAIHGFEDADKVAPLKWQQLIERRHARFFGVGENHLLYGTLSLVTPLWLLEVRKEHVLRAAQANPLGAELARLASILWRVRVGAHT